jgi:hypothetical protein
MRKILNGVKDSILTRGRPASRLDGLLDALERSKGEEFLKMGTWRAEAEVHLDLVMPPLNVGHQEI